MPNIRVAKTVKLGASLGLIIPAIVRRALSIYRGEYFDVQVVDQNTILFKRIKVAASGDFDEPRDVLLPLLKNE